jgi:hypothetical protein
VFSAATDSASLGKFGEVLSRSDTRIELLVARTDVPELVRHASALPIDDVTIEPMSLEDAFLEHYR